MLCNPSVLSYIATMSTVQEIEAAIQTLPTTEVKTLREWLEDYLEDQMEFTDEFKAKIERGEREIAEGKGRIRNPQADR